MTTFVNVFPISWLRSHWSRRRQHVAAPRLRQGVPRLVRRDALAAQDTVPGQTVPQHHGLRPGQRPVSGDHQCAPRRARRCRGAGIRRRARCRCIRGIPAVGSQRAGQPAATLLLHPRGPDRVLPDARCGLRHAGHRRAAAGRTVWRRLPSEPLRNSTGIGRARSCTCCASRATVERPGKMAEKYEAIWNSCVSNGKADVQRAYNEARSARPRPS